MEGELFLFVKRILHIDAVHHAAFGSEADIIVLNLSFILIDAIKGKENHAVHGIFS